MSWNDTSNRVSNPSFASDTSGWTGRNTTISRITSDYQSSPACLRLVSASTDWCGARNDVVIPVTEAREYAMSAWGKSASVTSTMYLQVNWFEDEAGTDLIASEAEAVGATSASEWRLGSFTFTAPEGARSATVEVSFFPATSGDTHYADTVSFAEPALGIADYLKLEVETDAELGTLDNLLENPTGELGAFGWETPVAGGVLKATTDGYTGYKLGLKYSNATADAGGQYFYTEAYPVTPGEYMAASWLCPYAPYGTYRVRVDYLDSSRVQINQSTWVTKTASTTTRQQINPASAVPASTAYARLRFEVAGPGGAFPTVYKVGNFGLRDVALYKAATAAELDTEALEFYDATAWTDILGPAHELQVVRESLSVGTLSATILDATLDPSEADTLRPGKKIRLMAFESETDQYSPLYTGKIDNAEVAYLFQPDGSMKTRIYLTAADGAADLANVSRSEGVATLDDLPYVLEGAGVPWNVNGSGNQVSAPTVVALNENASAIDQVAVTRDSVLGSAWVDRYNVLQAWDVAPAGHLDVQSASLDTTLTPWTALTNCSLTRDTVKYRSSPGSLRMIASAAGTMDAQSATGTAGIEVHEGKPYTARAWSSAGSTARSALLRMRWYDSAGALISTTSGSGTTNTSSDWTEHVVSDTAPAGAAYLTLSPQVVSAASGESHYWDDFAVEGPVVVMDESAYSDLEVGFNTQDCINTVTVRFLRYNSDTGQTDEIMYGPFTDDASIAQWGPRSAEFTIQDTTEDSVAIEAYADSILAANATPEVRVRSMRVPITSEDDLTTKKALADLYNLAVVKFNSSIDELSRIVGIEHNITPEGWLMHLTYFAEDSVATPQRTPAPQGALPDGVTTVGKLLIDTTTDANATAGNQPPLRIGDKTAKHLRIDGDEILAMADDDTPGNLIVAGADGASLQIGTNAMGGSAGTQIKKIRIGGASYSFDASGVATVNHGLGATPIAVFANNGNANFTVRCSGFTSTTFNLTLRDDATGAAITGNRICEWIAYA